MGNQDSLRWVAVVVGAESFRSTIAAPGGEGIGYGSVGGICKPEEQDGDRDPHRII